MHGKQAHGVAVEIRPLEANEVDLLERNLVSGPAGKHREYLYEQQRGETVYLVAWENGLPVGHIVLRWAGTIHEPVASRLRNCPNIEDLFVHPDYRKRGIGSMLLADAEELARRRRYPAVGLSVAVDNRPARTLYEHRGYRDSGFGTFQHTVPHLDQQGRLQLREETCVYLIKQLGGPLRGPLQGPLRCDNSSSTGNLYGILSVRMQ